MKRLACLIAISLCIVAIVIFEMRERRSFAFQIYLVEKGVFCLSGGVDSVEELERKIRNCPEEEISVEIHGGNGSSVGDIGHVLKFLNRQGLHKRTVLDLHGLRIALYEGHCHDNMRYFKEDDALQRYILTTDKFFIAQDRDFNFGQTLGVPDWQYLEEPDARDCGDVVQRARSLKAGHDDFGRKVIAEVYCGESVDMFRFSNLVSILQENGCNDLCLICF